MSSTTDIKMAYSPDVPDALTSSDMLKTSNADLLKVLLEIKKEQLKMKEEMLDIKMTRNYFDINNDDKWQGTWQFFILCFICNMVLFFTGLHFPLFFSMMTLHLLFNLIFFPQMKIRHIMSALSCNLLSCKKISSVLRRERAQATVRTHTEELLPINVKLGRLKFEYIWSDGKGSWKSKSSGAKEDVVNDLILNK